jgi:hypothetical protein
MGGEQIAVIGVSGRIRIDRLARPLDPVERVADLRERDLAAAQKAVEVEHHRLDVAVGPGRVDRAHHVAQSMFARDRPAAELIEHAAFSGLLDDRAVQVDHQSTRSRAAIGAVRQRRMERREEQQHEEQNQPVLDSDEQPPEAGK